MIAIEEVSVEWKNNKSKETKKNLKYIMALFRANPESIESWKLSIQMVNLLFTSFVQFVDNGWKTVKVICQAITGSSIHI